GVHEKEGVSVTLVTAEGGEWRPLAATGGPDLADIQFGKDRAAIASLLASPYLDVRTEEATVRLALDGLAAVMPAYDECMANIGKPAKGWTGKEVDQLIKAVKTGKARCVEDKQQRRTVCDVDWTGLSASNKPSGAPYPPAVGVWMMMASSASITVASQP